MVSYICIHSSYQEVTNKVMVQWQRCAACVCSGGHASGWTAVVTHLRVQCRMHRREQSAYVMLRDDVFVLWRAARTRAEGSWADRTPSWCGAWACKECFLTQHEANARLRILRNFEESATKKAQKLRRKRNEESEYVLDHSRTHGLVIRNGVRVFDAPNREFRARLE